MIDHLVTRDYPPDWSEIALAVKRAARWHCEHCGHIHDRASGHVLTVHHLDGDKANCDPSNLVALCQKCHLHIQSRWQPGQLVLPGLAPEWMTRRGWG